MARVTRRFLITGKVQGVYYRHSTRLQAERLGIGGVARNLPDGSVEVIAYGSHESVESLHAWLHRGPEHARVATVQELDPPRAVAVDGADAPPEAFTRFSTE